MLLLGIVLGIIGTKLFESRKRRLNKKLDIARQEGYNAARLGKFDVIKEA